MRLALVISLAGGWSAETHGFSGRGLLLSDIQQRSRFARPPLISTDGFKYCTKAVRRIYGGACVYGQVMKTWRKDRVAKVEKREVFGAGRQFERALDESEDSTALNTSFVERLNLTVRRGPAYSSRRTPGHARKERCLNEVPSVWVANPSP